jgi:ABC-type transport system involved in cytochrome bd biosynthesis fused ATPase/permease subunit
LDDDAIVVLNRVLEQYQGTVIMATHRPERLAHADVIWRLENCSLVEVTPVKSLTEPTTLSVESGH